LAAARLANAGCTAHEIQAITGHATLAMVAYYTKSASQVRLAEAAVVKLFPADKTHRTKRQNSGVKRLILLAVTSHHGK
jgi:hypothetical protein